MTINDEQNTGPWYGPVPRLPQMSRFEVRTMMGEGRTYDEVKAISDARHAKFMAIPVGRCRTCGVQIYPGDNFHQKMSSFWCADHIPEPEPTQRVTEADRHGIGCSWFDGITCDCKG